MAEEAKKKKDRGLWFREMKSELKKVVWPTPKQVFKNMGVVLAAVVAIGLFVFGLDTVFMQLLNLVMDVVAEFKFDILNIVPTAAMICYFVAILGVLLTAVFGILNKHGIKEDLQCVVSLNNHCLLAFGTAHNVSAKLFIVRERGI